MWVEVIKDQAEAVRCQQKSHHLGALVDPLLLSFCAVVDWLAGLDPDADPLLLFVRGSAAVDAEWAPLPAAQERCHCSVP